MSTITEEIIETLAAAPTAAELDQATRVSLGDLIRFGATVTEPAVGWGDGERACALSAAGLAYQALKRL